MRQHNIYIRYNSNKDRFSFSFLVFHAQKIAAVYSAADDTADADKEAADKVAALIDAIYVQERTDDTDEQCKEAKEAWDALTDAQKELVEGEEAWKSPDSFRKKSV